MNTISPNQLHDLHEQGRPINLFDVRTPAEFREAHAAYAKNAPLEALDPAALVQRCNGTSDQPIYVICRSGGRSAKACQALLAAGVDRVVNVEGGTPAREQAGPAARPRQK